MLTTRKASTDRPFKRRFRLFKAYSVTVQVLFSYLMLKIGRLVLGPDWADRRRRALHKRNAGRIVGMILSLKGLFIKVGQLISILTNFLPEDFRAELEALQDQIPPRPFEEIAAVVADAFGQPVHALFATFEAAPLASASLAQVHRATLPDGRQVAVKVQHIDIEAIARLDLRTIRHIVSLLAALFRVRGLHEQYQQVEEMILAELDFEQEAHYLGVIAANFAGDEAVSFPEVVQERSTRRVLTTTFVEGAKVTDLAALDAWGIDREALAVRIVEAYCQMIFQDGIYHADPHPGNLFVRPDGCIVFIDFGAVAALSPGMKSGIPRFVASLLVRDDQGITRALREMGFIAHAGAEHTVRELLHYVEEHLLGDAPFDAWQLRDINAESALEAKMAFLSSFGKLDLSLRTLTTTFRVPRDLILLERTLLLLMGLCTHLYPNMNPLQTIQPHVEAFVIGSDGSWRQLLAATARDVARAVMTVPGDLSQLLARANRGDLEVQIRGFRSGTRLLYALGHQFLYALFAMVASVLAYLAHLNDDQRLSWTAVGIAAFFMVALVGSFFRARRWEDGDLP